MKKRFIQTSKVRAAAARGDVNVSPLLWLAAAAAILWGLNLIG